jgi:dipeptidase D
MSTHPFEGLRPARVFHHFEAFTRRRRPSGEEDEAAAYVERWAGEMGYPVEVDAVGNRIVRVPATAGREATASVVLQGHLDMVCERNGDSPYDAAEGRLHVVREGDWIHAVGTTLGADDGIGVACAMAAAEELEHGPLELLFTIDEETGLTGAQQLDAERIRSRILLNLDSEEDSVLYVGCAGGMDTKLSLPVERVAAGRDAVVRRLAIKGLRGGHSGGDIHLDRLNAIQALVRLLQRAGDVRLVSIEGGSKRNAIPREAQAVVSLAPGDVGAFAAGIDRGLAELQQGWGGREPHLAVDIEAADDDRAPITLESTRRALAMLRGLPSGVIAMSQDIEGLVETSTNLGVVSTEADAVRVILCSRSSVPAAMRGVLDTIAAVATLAGAHVDEHGGYPGWRPDLDSKVLATTKAAYEKLFGGTPQVTAIHAGLECGLLGERVPGLDMVSFGPTILGAHSPDERVSIASVQKVYRLLEEVLRTIA